MSAIAGVLLIRFVAAGAAIAATSASATHAAEEAVIAPARCANPAELAPFAARSETDSCRTGMAVAPRVARMKTGRTADGFVVSGKAACSRPSSGAGLSDSGEIDWTERAARSEGARAAARISGPKAEAMRAVSVAPMAWAGSVSERTDQTSTSYLSREAKQACYADRMVNRAKGSGVAALSSATSASGRTVSSPTRSARALSAPPTGIRSRYIAPPNENTGALPSNGAIAAPTPVNLPRWVRYAECVGR